MKDKRRITRIGFVADESIDYFISLFVGQPIHAENYFSKFYGFNDQL